MTSLIDENEDAFLKCRRMWCWQCKPSDTKRHREGFPCLLFVCPVLLVNCLLTGGQIVSKTGYTKGTCGQFANKRWHVRSTQVNPSLCFVKVHHPSDAAVGLHSKSYCEPHGAVHKEWGLNSHLSLITTCMHKN